MHKLNPIKAILFDLDGVLVSTDKYHYQAWKKVADEEGIPFDHEINNRLRGVSRMECLEILLGKSPRKYSDLDKQALATRKNDCFSSLIAKLASTEWLPGALDFVKDTAGKELQLAVCSSSKNALKILEKLEGIGLFQAIVDGNAISRTKPDPQIFFLGAEKLGVLPSECLVFEDAEAGVEAAKEAGMQCVEIGDQGSLLAADYVISGLDKISACDVISE